MFTPLFNLPFEPWSWLVPAFFIGACIGSFLNVVIYRVPLGMSVNEPNRSFCPKCKKHIPMWLNLPLISWLWLRGKCAECGAPISFRYFGVELLTALLFTGVAWVFAPQSVAVVPFLWLLIAVLVSITFIDIEHMIIPTSLTWGGTVAGLIACAVWPQLPVMGFEAGTWSKGLMWGVVGWVTGYVGLRGVVELGKVAFGKKQMKFEEPVEWVLKEPEKESEPLLFVIDGEEIAWWDIFCRPTDRLVLQATDIRMSGEPVEDGTLTIREHEIELPDGMKIPLADIKSLQGKATGAVIPREAMGMGDPHLLGMIGAFFGWPGVFFAVFSSSVFAIIAAIIGRIGFGRPLPFGPFLALGGVAWMFGGWKLWEWYLNSLAPLQMP